MNLRAFASFALLAALALGLGWVVARNRPLAEASRAHDVSAWLRVQFGLDADAIGKISRLQAAFESACAEHCREVAEARSAVKAADTEANRARLAAALRRCEEARRAHVRELAACMPPEKGREYLELVLPRIAAAEHDGAPDAAGHGR
jgi:hypothetical protein